MRRWNWSESFLWSRTRGRSSRANGSKSSVSNTGRDPNSSSAAAIAESSRPPPRPDERALRRVPAVEVPRERVARRRADRVLVPDDRPAERGVAEAEVVVHVRQVLHRRVEVHVHLLDDHALLALDLVRIEAGVEEHVREHVERLRRLLAGALDVVARVLLAREGVEVGAHRVDLEADVARRSDAAPFP